MGDRLPATLIELETPFGVLRRSENDVDINGVLYERGLLTAPDPTRRMSDGGLIESSEVSLALADPTGLLRDAFLADAPRRLRGRSLVVKHWDGSAGGVPTTLWTGIVSQPKLNLGRLDVSGSNVNVAQLEQDYPRLLVTTADWPNAPDVGQRIPVALAGDKPRVKLLYVNQDDVLSQYDYLAPIGATGITALYRQSGGTLYGVEAKRTILMPTVMRMQWTGVYGAAAATTIGQDRALLVAIAMDGATSVSGVTYAGVAATKINHAANGTNRVEWWFLLAPAGGAANTLRVDFVGAQEGMVVAYGLTGVDQTMTASDFSFTSATGTSAAPSVTQAAAAGDLVLDVACSPNGGTATPGAAQADLENVEQGTKKGFASRKEGATSVTMSWALSTIRAWVTASIRVKPSPAYTVSTGIKAGRLVVRFVDKQVAVGSETALPIFADVTGPVAERNAWRAIRTFLSNAEWGFGMSVDAASFDAGEAVMDPAVSHLYCDGLIGPTTRKAQEILGDLLAFGNGRLAINAAGAWTIAGDVGRPAVPDLVVGDAVDVGPRNLFARADRCPPALNDSVATLVLRYRYYEPSSDFVLQVSRAVSSVGKERVLTNMLVQDTETADRLCDREAKRALAAEDAVSVELAQEARGLGEGSLVAVTDALLGYTGALLQVREITKPLTRYKATLVGYDPNAQVYVAGTLPADPTLGSATDYTRTPPAPVTNLAIAASGTEVGPDGTSLAYTVLAFDTPATNYSQAQVRYRTAGAAFWEDGGITTASGVGVQLRVSGLVPGQAYDYTVQTRNAPGTLTSVGDPALYNQTASTVGLPTAPSGLTLTTFGRSVLAVIGGVPRLPFDEARLYRNTSDTHVGATRVASGKQLAFVDVVPSIGATWHYWAAFVSGGIESTWTT